MIGTVGYMSPEQVRGCATDHRSDIFSFGTVLYEMLTGKRAFKGTTVADTLSAILREDPTEAVGTKPALAAALLRVVRRCLEKAPEDRFQSARDLAFALEGATAEVRIVAGEPRPAGRSSRVWKSVAAALALAGVAAGLGLWLGRATVPAPTPAAYERLTFRLGRIESAHFAPDGDTILYSAHPGGESPMELFSTRATTRGDAAPGTRERLDARDLFP